MAGSVFRVANRDDRARLAEWAASCVGPNATVVSMAPLRPEAPRWLLEVADGGVATRLILKAGSAGMRAELATEAAALAETHGLAAPRLLAADIDGHDAGHPAVLMTYIDGSDQIPAAATTERLRALGAAAAAFHQVSLTPTQELPLRHRHMPWMDLSAERRKGKRATTPLLDRADGLIAELPSPASDFTVFLHGDLWAGNTLWRDGSCVAIIDWEAAGAGNVGVDLGSLRLDAALAYGHGAGDEIVLGWEQTTDHQVDNLAYWDTVAALNTSADMAGDVPAFHAAGRRDLDGPTLTARRDGFLAAALQHVG